MIIECKIFFVDNSLGVDLEELGIKQEAEPTNAALKAENIEVINESSAGYTTIRMVTGDMYTAVMPFSEFLVLWKNELKNNLDKI